MTKVIELIYTEELVGNGTKEKPFGRAQCLFTLDGKPVARHYFPFEGANLKEFYPENLSDLIH